MMASPSSDVEAAKLPEDVLPTEMQVFQYYLYLKKVNTESKEWPVGISMHAKVKCIIPDIAYVWNKSGIPHTLEGRKGEVKVERLISRILELQHKKGFEKEKFDKLFDVAKCQCSSDSCVCKPEAQVPVDWRVFLQDQRSERKMVGYLNSTKLSLRSSTQRAAEDLKRKEEQKARLERKEERQSKRLKQEERSREETERLFSKVVLSEVERQDGVGGGDEDQEWVDEEEAAEGEGEVKQLRNLMQLPNFARACDRFKISDRAAAFLGSALLLDYGIIKVGDTFHVIDPSKLRRQRLKWGKVIASLRKTTASRLSGIYTDGKKVPTLVRLTTSTKVATGLRGRGANTVVSSTSNQTEVQDHYPVLAMPGAHYLTHVTPSTGTGLSLSKELVEVVRENDMEVKVIGMDGCSVNTGIHAGAIRLTELELGYAIQWVICGLHLIELVFWHILSEVDGVTKGPNQLSGPEGQHIHGDIWKLPVVKYKAIPGPVPVLPDKVVKEFSRDQQLAYHYCHAIQNGWMPDHLVNQVIGELDKSRWLTTGVRFLCWYTRTKNPSKRLVRLVTMELNLYFNGWFRFRYHAHIQDGSRNFYFLIEQSRVLEQKDTATAQKVLQDNAFWAHPENIIVSMMGDEDQEVRVKAVDWVRRARLEFNPEAPPRQFVPPMVDFSATHYTKMVDWEQVECTEPPLTRDMSEADLDEVVEKPYRFPDYPNHTQQVEAAVRVVSDAATKRADHTARDNLIHQLFESRAEVQSFNHKKDYLGVLK